MVNIFFFFLSLSKIQFSFQREKKRKKRTWWKVCSRGALAACPGCSGRWENALLCAGSAEEKKKIIKTKPREEDLGKKTNKEKVKLVGVSGSRDPPAPSPWQPLLGGRAAGASQQVASPPWLGVFGTAGVFVCPSRDCSTKWINPSLFRNLQPDRIPWDGQRAGESLVSKPLPSPLKPGSGERPPSMPAPAFPRSEKQVAKSQQNHERKTTET